MKGREFRKSERREVEEKEEKEKEEEEGEVQKELEEKVQRKDRNSLSARMKQNERQTSQSETSLGEIWKMALSLFASGAGLAKCQRCSRRIAEKDGDDGKVAAVGSSSEREQMGTRRDGPQEMKLSWKRC